MASTSHPSDAVSRVYAQALLELAEAQGDLAGVPGVPGVAEEVAGLSSLIEGNADLRRLIENPIIDRKARAAMIERLFKGNVSDLMLRFLGVLNRKNRLAALPGITRTFAELIAERNNELNVDAHVASPLDDATASRVSDSLGTSLGKKVTLRQHTDPSLLGGLKLRIGDKLIDASVSTQLKKIEQQLITAGREKARALSAVG